MASPAIDMGVLSIIGLGEGRGVSRCFCFRRSASFSCSHCSAILPQSMAAWLLDLEGEPGCVIQGLNLAFGSPEESPLRTPWEAPRSQRWISHLWTAVFWLLPETSPLGDTPWLTAVRRSRAPTSTNDLSVYCQYTHFGCCCRCRELEEGWGWAWADCGVVLACSWWYCGVVMGWLGVV